MTDPTADPADASDGVPATIVGNLQRGARLFPDRPLLTAGGRTVSYGEFAELVEGAAARLAVEGLRPGDRLAVCLPSGLDIAVAIWACARGGFVFTGLPVTLTPDEQSVLIAHADPALVLAADEFLPGLSGRGFPLHPVADLLTGRRLPWDHERPLPDPADVHALIYTSGTSGTPKGATVTHRAAMHVAGCYRRLLDLTPTDVTAICLPFTYVSGHLSQLNPFMLAGGSAVVLPRFDATELLRVLGHHRVTVVDVVPAMFALLLRHPGFRGERLPALRAAFFGGAPMPAVTIAALRDRLPDMTLHNVYGMTETAGLVTMLDDCETRPGSVGRPVPGARVRIVDDAGRVAHEGELLVSGPMVTGGYWRNPRATAAALRDGWLHTGDVARRDDEGYLYVLGRADDMINRGGAKINPADVQAALAAHPAVAEAAVFAVPDRLGGQMVAACVVLHPDAVVTAAQLRAFARTRLPVAARPKRLSIVDELPRGRTGKIDTAALRTRFERPQ
ncbi:MAG: hypothetical protein BGO26_13400 [Actinobacteria bacterium 69-20]|nr:AMP-binding protein [Actinomycetota bacterium]OJV23653.1 MAG: hypothetical protein BGO26_13400 [Actinobacteria bacterium 69-20]